MASNIRIGDLGSSAGLNTATTTVSGSYVATQFLTGSVSGIRDLPNTPGTLTGTGARLYGDQYEFIEFEGKIPVITINTLTSPANTNPQSGKRLDFTYTITGMQPGETGYVKIWVNGSYTGTNTSTINGNVSDVPDFYVDNSNTYIIPNSTNTLRLELRINSSNKQANDSKTVFVNAIDLTITSVVLSPSFTGAGTYNYTTGSVGFTVNVAGGISPYYYDFNGAGYGSADANTSTFNNASTTTDDAYLIQVKDSAVPFDTATNTPTTFRRPIAVSISTTTSAEPYVAYSVNSTVSYNVDAVAIDYAWVVTGASISTGTTQNLSLYYNTLGAQSARVNITNSSNTSIRNHAITSITVAMVSPSISATYSAFSETFLVNVTALTAAAGAARLRYDIDYALKDSGGSYGAWTSLVSNGTSTTPSVSIAGKTTIAQYAKARVRARRALADGSNEYLSGYTETGDILIPQKGVLTIADQDYILTGANRTFTGTVTIGGSNDNSFSVTSVSSTTTDSTVTASGARTSAGVITITVNNPCTSVNDGTSTHTATITDGNGYVLTDNFTVRYKILASQIGLSVEWSNGNPYNNTYNFISRTISTDFTLGSFQYNDGTGYTNVYSGGTFISSDNYTAPTANQTWYYRVKASGGTYRESDFNETSVLVYGYPNQSYGYSTSVSPTASPTLQQAESLTLTVSRSSGNFNLISATWTPTLPNGTTLTQQSRSDAQISDTAGSFSFDAVDFYRSNCDPDAVGSRTQNITLRYNIDASKYYTHTLDQNITVYRQPGSITTTKHSGFVSGYARRGISFVLRTTFFTGGPPYAESFSGTFHAYLNDSDWPSFPSDLLTQVDDENTSLGFFSGNSFGITYGDSTYCRKYFEKDFAYTSNRNISGTTKNYYGAEYNVVQYTTFPEPFYKFVYAGNANSTSIGVVIRGRRATTFNAGYTFTATADGVGSTNIGSIGGGNWSSNIKGDDGACDISLDGLVITYQRSSDNSTWTDLAGSSYDPGSFGTYYFRAKIQDDWGNTLYTNSTSVTTRDWDYSLTLSGTDSTPDVRVTAGVNVFSFVNSSYPNKFTFSTTDPGAGSETEFPISAGVSSYFLTVSGPEDSSFPGAYMVTSNSSGANNIIDAIFVGSPYNYWVGTSSSSKSSVRYTSVTGRKYIFFFSMPGSYGQTGLLTVTTQKSSTDTQNQKKYYLRWKTPPEVNQVTLSQIATNCSSITVRAAIGTINTADTLYIQTSPDGAGWTDVHGPISISANTNYDRTITGIIGTIYVRARIYAGGTLKTTSNTVTYTRVNAISAVGGIAVPSTSSNTPLCSTLTYSFARAGSANSSNAYQYYVTWYECSFDYGVVGSAISQGLRNFDQSYTVSMGGIACDTPLYYEVYAISETNCTGTARDACLIYKSANLGCDCGATCLAKGTKILMWDGSEKNVEDLVEGDLVKNISIDGFSEEEDAWKTFTTNQFNYVDSMSAVKFVISGVYHYHYIINNKLKITFEHPIFVRRNDEYKFLMAEDIIIGDMMYNANGEWEMIEEKIRVDELDEFITLGVETNDTYFANNILVHNVGPGGKQEL
jgi:hypothetical protein